MYFLIRLEPQKSLENILERAQGQRRDIASDGCNRKTTRPTDKEEIALRWSCYKGELGTSFAVSLGGQRAEEVKDALKGAGRTTSSNGPTFVHMEKSNGKLIAERNGDT
ncbi:hypothetical protein ElyMa_002145800 [Elysia marginata]|uniref:Uncharacterized protein n=1 Tax=Elysia marginata TaxID=1093978 RepID=A0AAV4FLL4_9GAST|nr:hypothetical protein ElyMa_002145800 [Elysia marginata]